MIVAGFGFRSEAGLDSLRDALAIAAGQRKVASIATVTDKAESSLFQQFAQELGLPVHAVDKEALINTETMTNSPASQANYETGSVAEASALAAAGTGAKLIQSRVISNDRMATCALAETVANIEDEGSAQ